jgi:glycosyltransferase involved in cell wall biosynthesis
VNAASATHEPLVSVVVAAYNAADFINETIESIFAQGYASYEVIVVDDGSTDATGEIVQSFPQIRYFRQENAGAAAARNVAIAMSHGELIAPVDADDVVPSSKLRVQVDYLLRNPQVACVMGRQEWINPPEWLGRDAVYGDLDGIPLLSGMFRRSVFDAVGGFDSKYEPAEDTNLLVRMREHGLELAVIPEIVLYRRFRESSLTGRQRRTPTAATPLLQTLRDKVERDRVRTKASSTRPETPR